MNYATEIDRAIDGDQLASAMTLAEQWVAAQPDDANAWSKLAPHTLVIVAPCNPLCRSGEANHALHRSRAIAHSRAHPDLTLIMAFSDVEVVFPPVHHDRLGTNARRRAARSAPTCRPVARTRSVIPRPLSASTLSDNLRYYCI